MQQTLPVRVILLPRTRPIGPVPFALLLPFGMSVAEDDIAAFDTVILKFCGRGSAAAQVPRQRRLLCPHPARAVLRTPPDAEEFVTHVPGIGRLVVGGLD